MFGCLSSPSREKSDENTENTEKQLLDLSKNEGQKNNNDTISIEKFLEFFKGPEKIHDLGFTYRKEIPSKYMKKFLNIDSKSIGLNDSYYGDTILMDSEIIGLVYHSICAAGGTCYRKKLATITIDGTNIENFLLEGSFGDGEFSEKITSEINPKGRIEQRTSKIILDVETMDTIKEDQKIEYYQLSSNGKIIEINEQ
jgi:hypothetical protein